MIKDQNQQILAKGHKKGQLYALNEAQMEVFTTIKSPKAFLGFWHQ